jgi:CubicO group peptidase (beta-lactamase class C family)
MFYKNYSQFLAVKKLVIFTILILTCKVGRAQTASDTAMLINQLFQRYQPQNPGGQLAVSVNGKVIFSKAWGLAEIEHQSQYTTTTLGEAGSISKQFTAAAILILEQQGKLSLDDDVRKYIPELPNYGLVVRLRNLLHHTSGLREWSDLEAITGWPRTTKAYRNEDVLKLLCSQKGLNNTPGTEFIYSNSNYILLTLIVERISGMTLPAFTKRYIFDPAGMSHTTWRDDYKKVVPNRAVAYTKTDTVYRVNMPNESVYGPGGLLTTAEDLLKWNNYYLNNKLGSPGLLSRQLAIDPTSGGQNADYAAGLFVDTMNGIPEISHTGQTASYVGIVKSFPTLKLSIAWLSNTTEFRSGLFDPIAGIEKIFIKNTPVSSAKNSTQQPMKLSTAAAKQYIGWYSSNANNKGIKIELKNDTLFIRNTPLIPIADGELSYDDAHILFTPSGDFIFTTDNNRKIGFTKQPESDLKDSYLKTFTGTYYSKETQSDISIVFKNGKLMLEKDYLKDAVLKPTYQQAFNCDIQFDSELSPTTFNLIFKKEKATGLLKFKISADDARNIEFEKVE